jgi:hypothetical protein
LEQRTLLSVAALSSATRAIEGLPWSCHIDFQNSSGNPLAVAADFSVDINWGDGTSSDAKVVALVGHRLFRAVAAHAFAEAGVQPFSTGSDAQNQILLSYQGASAQEIAAVNVKVTDRPLVPLGMTKPVVINSSGQLSGLIGTFRDWNALANASDFQTASTTVGAELNTTISPIGAGKFSVSAIGTIPTTTRSLVLKVMDIGGSQTLLRTRLVLDQSAPTVPVSTIADAYVSAQPGDVIIIQPGTYTESLDLNLSGTATAPITLEAATPGTVILDGGGTLTTAISGNGQFNVISGFVIQNFASTGYQNEQAAIRTNTGWQLNNLTVQDCSGTGIGVFGNDVSLTNVISQDNGSNGIGGSGATNVTLTDCMSLANNTGALFAAHDPTDEGGGGKWTECDGLTFIRYHGDDNCGPGLWLDFENKNVTLIDCEGSGNHSGGPFNAPDWIGAPLAVEANFGPVMVTSFHASATNTGALGIWESASVTVSQSSLLSGVNFRTLDRGVAGLVDDQDTVTNSTIDNLSLTGNPPTNLTLAGNTYLVAPGYPFV